MLQRVNFVNYALPLTGKYTIVIRENDGDGTDNYSISLQCREQVQANAKAITFDTSLVDTVKNLGQMRGIVFNGITGDRITIKVKPNTAVSSVFQLVAPNGTKLHDSTTVDGSLNQVTNLTLPQIGKYTVFIYSVDGTETFTYTAVFVAITFAHDGGVVEIVKPDSFVDPNTTVRPAVFIKNYGTTNDTVSAYLTIGSTYSDSIKKYLVANRTDTAKFKDWAVPANGTYVARRSVAIGNETYVVNNVKERNVVVRAGDGPQIFSVTPNRGGE